MHESGGLRQPKESSNVHLRWTHGRAVRIHFDGGRSVDLTTLHVLPVGPIDDRGFTRVQRVIHAGEVEPGDSLLDGVVEHVESLGERRALRIWTAWPEWLRAPGGIRIGSRWHENMDGFLVTDDRAQSVCAVGWGRQGRRGITHAELNALALEGRGGNHDFEEPGGCLAARMRWWREIGRQPRPALDVHLGMSAGTRATARKAA